MKVRIVDAGRLGGEASWAGAGMLAPGSEYERRTQWLDFSLHSLALYPEFVAELKEASGSAIDFSMQGSFELAELDEEIEALVRKAEQQTFWGIPCERVDHSGLPDWVGASMRGGIFYPNSGQVDPRNIMVALHRIFRDRGVEIVENTAIHNADPKDQAGCVVVAAGAWASQIGVPGDHFLPDAYPIKGHLIGYEMPPGSVPKILRFKHTYLLQRQSGYVIVGSNEERAGFDRSIRPAIVDYLAEWARTLCPLLPDKPKDSWIGFRPATFTEGPVMGRWDESKIWLAYGHYRNGILMAPATAEQISTEIIANWGKD